MFQKLFFFTLIIFSLSCKTNIKETASTNIVNPQQDSTELQVPKELKKYYSDVDFSLRSIPLYEDLAVTTITKHSDFLSYGERHKYLYRMDAHPEHKDSVILMYSGEVRYWKEYMSSGNPHKKQTFNTEHVYPQSLIENTAKGDLHHLRACDQRTNTRRSNNPFTKGKGSYKLKHNSWYPGDEWKGDVARMVMYLNLRYNESFEDVGDIALFLKWNAEDPVSPFEEQRNKYIQKAQGNRNPFIDNPYLATLIWGGKKAENRWE